MLWEKDCSYVYENGCGHEQIQIMSKIMLIVTDSYHDGVDYELVLHYSKRKQHGKRLNDSDFNYRTILSTLTIINA